MIIAPQVEYGGLSVEDINQAHARVSGGNANYFKPKEGNSYVLRILPGPPQQSAVVTVYQHFFEKYNGSKKVLSFNCPQKGGTGECPACAAREKLLLSTSPTDVSNAREYEPKPRCFCVVIDRGAPELGPQVWAFPKGVMDELHSLRTDIKKYGQDFTHPYTGDDLYLEVKAGRFREYKLGIAHNSQKRLAVTDEQIVAWMNAAPNLAVFTKTESTTVVRRKIFMADQEAKGVPTEQASVMADRMFGAISAGEGGPSTVSMSGLLSESYTQAVPQGYAPQGYAAPQYAQQPAPPQYAPQQYAQQPAPQQYAPQAPQQYAQQTAPTQYAPQAAQQAPAQYAPQGSPVHYATQVAQQAAAQGAPVQYAPQAAPQGAPVQYAPQAAPQGAPVQYAPQAAPQTAPVQYAPQAAPHGTPVQYAPQAAPHGTPVQYAPQAQQQPQQFEMGPTQPMSHVAHTIAQNPAAVEHNF